MIWALGEGANVQYACITGDQYIGQYIVACQGGGVSSKTRRDGADKTLAWNPLVR